MHQHFLIPCRSWPPTMNSATISQPLQVHRLHMMSKMLLFGSRSGVAERVNHTEAITHYAKAWQTIAASIPNLPLMVGCRMVEALFLFLTGTF